MKFFDFACLEIFHEILHAGKSFMNFFDFACWEKFHEFFLFCMLGIFSCFFLFCMLGIFS